MHHIEEDMYKYFMHKEGDGIPEVKENKEENKEEDEDEESKTD